jgi:Fe-S cluster assembly protein SufD
VFAVPGARRVVFANGHLVGASPVPLLSAEPADAQDGILALNAALASPGLDLVVTDEGEPLHLATWFGGQDLRMAHLRHRIRVQRGARQVLVLHELGDDAQFFATQVLDVELGEGAQLDLYRIQQPGRRTSLVTRIDVRLARDGRFTGVSLHGGGVLVRNDINVSLDAPGAEAVLNGVLLPGTGEHLDVHTRLDHRAPHGRSREAFRAIVAEKARAVFNGKVIVHPDAQKTDSEQHIDSLLLAAGAEIDAKPELEIYADDVKCAHGATVGQLDEQALYYLRSRGIDLATGRTLLLLTFARRILDGIAFAPARRLAEQVLAGKLGSDPDFARSLP